MYALIALLIILLQPPVDPPPTPTPIVVGDPCENMTPVDNALIPSTWILPDGTDCTPDVIPVIVIDDVYAEPPPPVFEDTPPVVVEVEPTRRAGFAHVSRAGELRK